MKDLRMRHLFNHSSNKIIITPLDHGVTLGPIEGIVNIRSTVEKLINTKINAIVLHKGNIVNCRDIISTNKDISVIMHLSASIGFSPNSERKVLVASVEEGARYGVDAVSIHVNIGNEYDYQMITDLGKVAEECEKWGIPLLAMIYPRGKNVDEKDLKYNMIGARTAMEIGADIVKINYTGDKKSFEKIITGVNIPVVIAGGEYENNEIGLLKEIKDAIDIGAAGVAMGRNIFQKKNMLNFITVVHEIINNGFSIEDISHMAVGE